MSIFLQGRCVLGCPWTIESLSSFSRLCISAKDKWMWSKHRLWVTHWQNITKKRECSPSRKSHLRIWKGSSFEIYESVYLMITTKVIYLFSSLAVCFLSGFIGFCSVRDCKLKLDQPVTNPKLNLVSYWPPFHTSLQYSQGYKESIAITQHLFISLLLL